MQGGLVCMCLAAVAVLASGSSLYDLDGAGMYDDLLMQDLYKRLAQLQPSADYYYDDDGLQVSA